MFLNFLLSFTLIKQKTTSEEVKFCYIKLYANIPLVVTKTANEICMATFISEANDKSVLSSCKKNNNTHTQLRSRFMK